MGRSEAAEVSAVDGCVCGGAWSLSRARRGGALRTPRGAPAAGGPAAAPARGGDVG